MPPSTSKSPGSSDRNLPTVLDLSPSPAGLTDEELSVLALELFPEPQRHDHSDEDATDQDSEMGSPIPDPSPTNEREISGISRSREGTVKPKKSKAWARKLLAEREEISGVTRKGVTHAELRDESRRRERREPPLGGADALVNMFPATAGPSTPSSTGMAPLSTEEEEQLSKFDPSKFNIPTEAPAYMGAMERLSRRSESGRRQEVYTKLRDSAAADQVLGTLYGVRHRDRSDSVQSSTSSGVEEMKVDAPSMAMDQSEEVMGVEPEEAVLPDFANLSMRGSGVAR